jgi:hypothetical protein
MPWQFLVVDGADVEQVFPLPERGTVLIGSSQKHAEICLHDLYVARTHCEIHITDEDAVLVRNLRPVEGILVNNVRVEQEQALNAGDILRVGNSHLRLQPAAVAGSPPAREVSAQTPDAPGAEPERSRALPSLPPERLRVLSGHLLGNYRLGEVLDHTVHRTVFRACHVKSQENVVVKVMSPCFPARPQELQHFAEVMRKALPLRHDFLVTLHGAGKTGPYTWLAREHVPGESLAAVFQRIASKPSKVKWQSGLRLLVQIGMGLDYLHQQHVQHGQLTPDDVLLNTETKQAKLANVMLDEALAGSHLHGAVQSARRAKHLAYFSPEQCHSGAFVDELSDQYSLGALVYARMTGQPPFAGATPEETEQRIQTSALIRPRQLNTAIPVDVETVVVRMLARHQEDRYPRIASVLAELGSH